MTANEQRGSSESGPFARPFPGPSRTIRGTIVDQVYGGRAASGDIVSSSGRQSGHRALAAGQGENAITPGRAVTDGTASVQRAGKWDTGGRQAALQDARTARDASQRGGAEAGARWPEAAVPVNIAPGW